MSSRQTAGFTAVSRPVLTHVCARWEPITNSVGLDRCVICSLQRTRSHIANRNNRDIYKNAPPLLNPVSLCLCCSARHTRSLQRAPTGWGRGVRGVGALSSLQPCNRSSPGPNEDDKCSVVSATYWLELVWRDDEASILNEASSLSLQ